MHERNYNAMYEQSNEKINIIYVCNIWIWLYNDMFYVYEKYVYVIRVYKCMSVYGCIMMLMDVINMYVDYVLCV